MFADFFFPEKPETCLEFLKEFSLQMAANCTFFTLKFKICFSKQNKINY